MSDAEILAFIKNATRFWVVRANSPQIEQRHKAEMMLDYLAEAENVLLDPIKRKNFDDTRNKKSSHSYEADGNYNSANKKSEYSEKITCSRCGLRQKRYSAYCLACGYIFADNQLNPKEVLPFFTDTKEINNQYLSPSEEPSHDLAPNKEENLVQQTLSYFGWLKLTGFIIAVEPPYMGVIQKSWLATFLKLSLGVFLLPILLGVVAGVMIMKIIFQFSGYRRSGQSSQIISQIGVFFLHYQLIKPRKQITIRDIRLRDQFGQEHLLRIQGQLVTGNLVVGDEVEVEGFNRRGTLMVRQGFNKRTRSEIRIRRI